MSIKLFPRYRAVSLRNVLGITRAKRRFNRAIGLTTVRRPFRAPGNAHRRALRHAGYYGTLPKTYRLT